MPTITLKNIPEDLYIRLKSSAEEHRRSMNSEAIVCLEKALRSYPVDPDSFLVEARQRRGSLAQLPQLKP